MKIHETTEQFIPTKSPIALTIGNFDGVHLGHQAVIHRLKQAAAHTVVFTFSNHPQEILRGSPLSLLTTLPHRLALLQEAGIDQAVVIPFTKPFSEQTAKVFLSQLKRDIPFTHLILGHDAMVGSDRETNLRKLCGELAFSLEYLPPFSIDGQVISSTLIRKAIQEGDLTLASRLLGRPYSILGTVQPGHGKGASLGFPTANIPVANLILPPLGVYAVDALIDGKSCPAIANLGKAPTLHTDRPPCLEVHLINQQRNLYNQPLEVRFKKFLRSERKFESITDLQKQIAIDIQMSLDFKFPPF